MGMRGMGVGMSRGAIGARSFAAIPTSRATFGPNFSRSRAAFAPGFARPALTHHAFFHHRFHHFRRFAFIGVGGPFYASYDYCWRRVWTAWGPQWINVCSDYSWNY